MITKADFKILLVGAKAEGAAFYGKGMTDMYGVNNSVNTSNVYNYGKNAKAQGPQEQQKSTPPKKAMRADEILFSEVYNADKSSVDALGLSDNAKNLLLELKEKYKGYDFMVGDYETDEQASRILNGGRGTLMNVLITPDLLEEMAADESVRAKYENIIAGASDQFTAVKSKLTESGKYYLGSLGLTVNKDGSCNFYGFLKNGLTNEDGSNFLKASSAQDFADMLNALAEKRAEQTEKIKSENGIMDENLVLGDKEQKLLDELRSKYKGYDFMLANWSTDEEAAKYLATGQGEKGNVLITADLLTRMANDETERAKYEAILDEAANGVGKVKDQLTEEGKSVVDKVGASVDNDGKLTYFAKLVSGLAAKDGSKFIKASSTNELVEMLNAYALNKIEVEETEEEDPNKLSDKARAVLNELMDKYRGYEFIVGNWKTDEEASRVLSYGRGKDGNVLISPELLEEMANDESVKAKYMGIIDEAAGKFNQAKEQLTEDGRSIVEKLGMTVGADGSVSFFAKLVDGVTADDGGSYIKCSIIEDFTKSLNTLAEARKKMSAEKEESNPVKLDTPEEKEEKVEKSVMPPKSYEKYRKEENPYSTEEDYGTMPPKSFEKYAKEENPYSTEEDYGTLPPESFKKYQDAASETDIPGDTMNYTV